MYNRYLFNPAYAGSNDAGEVSAIYRAQYVGLASKAISSQGFNFNIPVYTISSGVGLTVINDLIGFQRSTYVSLNYAYAKDFKWGKLSAGLGAGIVQTSLDGSQIRTPDGVYQGGVNHNDNTLPLVLSQGVAPDFSLGLYINSAKYFAGVSVNHIAFSTAKVNGITRLNFSRNLLVSGGYDFAVSKKLSIMPSLFLKTDFKQVQTDLGASFTIINNILTGISFRGYSPKSVDALNIMAGVSIKGIRLVYSYDANLNYLTKFNFGSHEVSLAYRFVVKKKEKRGYYYYNPRYT
jgi:type IX secretion system PorP/SprF family membrane protein